jgi:sensor histidine kinase YesM
MKMDVYTAVYLVAGILVTFAIARFMRVFFEVQRTSFFLMVASYVLFYFITSTTFFILNLPIISTAVSISLYFLLTLNYKGSLSRRLAAVACIFSFLVMAEIMAAILSNSIFTSLLIPIENDSIFAFVVWGVLSYAVASLFQRFKNIKSSNIPKSLFWLSLLTVPASSVFVSLLILSSPNISQIFMILAIMIIFGINLLTFYQQDALSIVHENKLKLNLLAQEKEYLVSQCQIMQASEERIRSYRHDIKHHLSIVKGLSEKRQGENAVKYLESLLGGIMEDEICSNTGNLAFDSIINHKLRDAKRDGIDLQLNILVPESFDNIELSDIAIILGNLLDNALEATNKTENKWIKVVAKYDKGALFIEVENSFDGKILYSDTEDEEGQRQIISSKSKKGHGYGLKNVRQAVDRCGGHMEVTHTDASFLVGTLLYGDGSDA